MPLVTGQKEAVRSEQDTSISPVVARRLSRNIRSSPFSHREKDRNSPAFCRTPDFSFDKLDFCLPENLILSSIKNRRLSTVNKSRLLTGLQSPTLVVTEKRGVSDNVHPSTSLLRRLSCTPSTKDVASSNSNRRSGIKSLKNRFQFNSNEKKLDTAHFSAIVEYSHRHDKETPSVGTASISSHSDLDLNENSEQAIAFDKNETCLEVHHESFDEAQLTKIDQPNFICMGESQNSILSDKVVIVDEKNVVIAEEKMSSSCPATMAPAAASHQSENEHSLIAYQASLLNLTSDLISPRVMHLPATIPVELACEVIASIHSNLSTVKVIDEVTGDPCHCIDEAFDAPDSHHSSEAATVLSEADSDMICPSENKLFTSFRIKLPMLKNPLDFCILPDDYFAVADYNDGLVILSSSGNVIEHNTDNKDMNACGVVCVKRPSEDQHKLLVLLFQNSLWKINVYEGFQLTLCINCPDDKQIENWALRRIVVTAEVDESRVYLLASGEYKSCIWKLNMDENTWTLCFSQFKKGCGIFSDISIRCCHLIHDATSSTSLSQKTKKPKFADQDPKRTTQSMGFDSIATAAAANNNNKVRFLLCDWRKARLKTFMLNDKGEQIYNKTVKVRRVRGQQWIVQGPVLSTLDEEMDIIVYDASGKIFLFDGEHYKLKKIIADVGRGEVTSLVVKGHWLYVLCRHKLCIEAFLYKDDISRLS